MRCPPLPIWLILAAGCEAAPEDATRGNVPSTAIEPTTGDSESTGSQSTASTSSTSSSTTPTGDTGAGSTTSSPCLGDLVLAVGVVPERESEWLCPGEVHRYQIGQDLGFLDVEVGGECNRMDTVFVRANGVRTTVGGCGSMGGMEARPGAVVEISADENQPILYEVDLVPS